MLADLRSIYTMCLSLLMVVATAQSFNMSNGAVNSCYGTFYDSGGAAGNYGNNESYTLTICPDGGSGSGAITSIEFTVWSVQAGTNDELIIYNGDNTAAPVLDIGNGANSLLGNIYNGGATGCLTFEWTSNNGGTATGWEALILTGPDAGISQTTNICDNQGNFDLFTLLGGTPANTGSWTDPSNAAHSNVFDPSVDPGGVWTYTVPGGTGCNDATATVSITLLNGPDAGGNGARSVCETDPGFNLIDELSGTPDAGGSWDGPNGAHGGFFDPAVDPAGSYEYTVAGAPPCQDASAIVLVSVNTQPDAGTNGSITICSDDGPFSLFAQLGGNPDAGGTWTDGSGTPHPATYSPGSSLPGVYTYTITAQAPCSDVSSTVTVSENQAVDAGIDNTIAVCSDDAVFNLIDQLAGNPDAGGVWTFGGNVVADVFNPSTDPAGTYTYTLTSSPPCVDDFSTLDITINTATDAGVDGSAIVCSNDPSFQLIDSLGGTPQTNGTWTDPSGIAFNGNFVPGVSVGGTYTYTVAGIAPCVDDVSVVNVQQTSAPNPGSNAALAVCSDDTPFNLYDLLGGTPDAGGTWTDPNGDPHVDPFDPATTIGGVYTYTVAGTGPCNDASATVSITLNQAPDAGNDTSLDICSDTTTVDLFGVLDGTPDPTGSWLDPNGNAFSGLLDPINGLAGIYTYSVPGIAPCVDAVATVTVSITQAPEAGLDGNITVCSDGPIVPLFNELGGTPDINGQWFRPNGNPFNGNYNPVNQLGGVHLYVVTGTGPCFNDTSQVQVIRNIAPDAGTPGAITVCETDAQFGLLTVLGGSPMNSGVWTDPSGVIVSPGVFTPGVSVPGIYTYVVAGNSPCLNDTSTAEINVSLAPDAGGSVSISVCGNQAPFSLFDELTGTPDIGGTWEFNGNAHGLFYDPTFDVSGSYTYIVAGPIPCADASSSVIVLEVDPVNGGGNSTIDICESDAPLPLFGQLTGNPDIGGTWTGPSGSFSGVFDPAIDVAGVYSYRVQGTAPCADSIGTVAVNLLPTPLSGDPGSISVCPDIPQVDLFTVLTGSFDFGGTWNDDDNTGQLAGSIFSPFGLSNGNYDFTYSVNGNGNCSPQSTTVTVTVVGSLDAGQNNAVTICSSEQNFVLFPELAGTPQTGGIWSDDNNSNGLAGGVLNASNLGGGIYNFTYLLSGTQGCASDSSQLQVTVVQEAYAGVDDNWSTCSSLPSFDMLLQLAGNPPAGGFWVDPNGVSHSNFFDPATDISGVYSYVISGQSPCENDTAELDVVVVGASNAGTSDPISVCSDQGAFNLLDSLQGSPDITGTWIDPNNQTHSGTLFPGSDPSGGYLYTVPGNAPCPDAFVVLNVQIEQPPNSGNSSTVTFCHSGVDELLIGYLVGAQSGGTWTDPDGNVLANGIYSPDTATQGTYTYTVDGLGNCANSSSTLQVFVNSEADAGISDGIDVCSNSGLVDLFAQLGGTPQQGGTWTDPFGQVHSGQFNPSTDTPGSYKYKVIGVQPCPSDSSVVSVSLFTQPNAGNSSLVQLCDNGQPIDMFFELGGSPDPGGTWTNSSGAIVTGFYLPGLTPPDTYTYTVAGSGLCASDNATVTVSESQFLTAGNSAPLSVCETDGSVNLLSVLGGGADQGGVWTDPNGAVHSGSFSPSNDAPGPYQYLISGQQPCAADSAVVFMGVDTVPDAGITSLITVCSDQNSFTMRSRLNGTPDLIGSWNGPAPSTQLVSGVYNPGSTTPGTYTFTVPSNGACAQVSSQLTIVENVAPYAGVNTVELLCSADLGSTLNLIDSLDGNPDAGGTWLDPSLNVFSGVFNVGVDPNGAYSYVVDGISPCLSDTAVLQLSVTAAPDPGISSAVVLCSSDDPAAIVSLLIGTPDQNGTWTGPDSLAFSPPIFDPTTDAPGVYTYFVQGSFPCDFGTSSVTIAVVDSANAGADSSLVTCLANTSFDLSQALSGADPNGGWLDLDGTGALSGTIFDASQVVPGNYTFGYRVLGGTNCNSDTAFVDVTVQLAFDAGKDTSVTYCSSQSTVDLFQLLGPGTQAGGTWVDLDGTGQVGISSGLFEPSLVSAMSFWSFRYVVNGIGGCSSDSALINIFVDQGPDAGFGLNCFRCSTDPNFSLFDCLAGGDAGGQWFSSDGTLLLTDSINPAVDTSDVFTYVVQGGGACPPDSSFVPLTITIAPDPGISNIINVCDNDFFFTMTDSLNGTPSNSGGWFVQQTTPISSVFNPQVDTSGTYAYVVQPVGGCPGGSATLSITVDHAPDAGSDGVAIPSCSNDPPFDLYFSLSTPGDFGGQWFSPSLTPRPSSFLDPSVDTSGTYSYVVYGNGGCENDTAEVVVSITQGPNAGDTTVVDTCILINSLYLFDLLDGNPDANGFFIPPAGLQPFMSANNDTLYLAGLAPNVYDFVYVVQGTSPCADDVALLSLDFTTGGAQAGNDLVVDVCSNIGSLDLSTILSANADPGGTWNVLTGNPACVTDSILDVSCLDADSLYTFTYTVVEPNCGSDVATISLNIVQAPFSGQLSVANVCESDAPFDMLGQFVGLQDSTGLLIGPSGPINSTFFFPGVSEPGQYLYIVNSVGVCGVDTAILQVNVFEPANAGFGGTATTCAGDFFIDLTGYTVDSGGVWIDLDNSGGLDSAGILALGGIPPDFYSYQYVVTNPGCGADTADVFVNLLTQIEVTNVTFECDMDEWTYTATFDILFGDSSSYDVSGVDGVLIPGSPFSFQTDPLLLYDSLNVLVTGGFCGNGQLDTIGVCDFGSLVFVPESYSPNGDGINDFFEIQGIEGFPNNTIEIYNRWGDLIWDAAGYDNTTVRWEGVAKNALIQGEVPSGTYYYVLDLGVEGAEVVRGFVYVVK